MPNQHQRCASSARTKWILSTITSILIAFVLLALISSRDIFFLITDLGIWLDDFQKLYTCLGTSGFNACEEISKFPLGYLINSILLQPLRAANGDPRAGMQVLQIASLCLPIPAFIACNAKLRTGLGLSAIYLLILALTPLPSFYVNSGALEIQSGAFLGMALIFGFKSLGNPRQEWLFLSNACLLLGCLYKDTLGITFAVAVILACLISRMDGRGPSTRMLIRTWGPGLILAIASSLTWNAIRYHNLLPLGYLEEASLNRPSMQQALMSLWALYLSPNGGLVRFWGCALAVLMFLHSKQLNRYYFLDLQRILPITLLLTGVSSMALWWSPFGWVAWGARLSVPFALAAVIGSLSTLNNSPKGLIHISIINTERANRIALIITVAATVLLTQSLPYVALGYIHDHSTLFIEKKETGKTCTEKIIAEMRQQKYGHPNPGVRMWRTRAFWPCIEDGMRHDPTKLRN